jgi:hypothetical protein
MLRPFIMAMLPPSIAARFLPFVTFTALPSGSAMLIGSGWTSRRTSQHGYQREPDG